jgi:hypothetical protein
LSVEYHVALERWERFILVVLDRVYEACYGIRIADWAIFETPREHHINMTELK